MLDTYDVHAMRLLIAKAEAVGIWRTKDLSKSKRF